MIKYLKKAIPLSSLELITVASNVQHLFYIHVLANNNFYIQACLFNKKTLQKYYSIVNYSFKIFLEVLKRTVIRVFM